MARKYEAAAVYEVAELFRNRCLRAGGSLLWPGSSVWTCENIERLSATLVHIELGCPFYEQWCPKLSRESEEVSRLACDIVAFYYLFPADLSRHKKFARLKAVVDWRFRDQPLEVTLLEPAFGLSVGTTGCLYLAKISQQIAFFLAFANEAVTRKSDLLDAACSKALATEVSRSIPYSVAGLNVLLHLLFPDHFEGIMSRSHKQRILQAFGRYPSETCDLDDGLLAVRGELEKTRGKNFDFYEPRIREVWNRASKATETSPE